MRKTLSIFILCIFVAVFAYAAVDTKDGTAITASSNMDGFTSNLDDVDGQAISAGGCTTANDSLLEEVSTFSSDGTDALGNDTQILAQSFQNASAFTCTQICINIIDNSQDGGVTGVLYNDNSGEPDHSSPVAGGSVTLAHGDISDTGAMTCFEFATPLSLSGSTTYHFGLERYGSAGSFGVYYDGNEYANGQQCISVNSGSTWDCYSGAYDYDIEVWGCE